MFLLVGAGAPPAGVGAGACAARRDPVAGETRRIVAEATIALDIGKGPDLDACGALMAADYSHTIGVKRQRRPGIGRLARLLQAERVDRPGKIGQPAGVPLGGATGTL